MEVEHELTNPENEDKQPSNLTLKDGQEVGGSGGSARGGRPLACLLYTSDAADE